MKTLVALGMALGVWWTASLADAAPTLRSRLSGEARAAFDRGVELYDAKDARGALGQFTLAYERSREPRLLVNLAVVERDLGHYARGLVLLRRALGEGERSLNRSEKQSIRRSIAAFEPLTTPLTLTTDPPGATVLVDEVPIGTTPLPEGTRIDLGRRTIVLRREGHREATITREVTAPLDLKVALEPLQRLGRLEIDVTTLSVRSRVLVDEVPRGSAPLSVEVPEGVRRVAVEAPGYLREERSVEARHQRTERLRFTLRRDALTLEVKAPSSDDSIWLDGKRIGRGSFRGEVRSGTRRLEVRDGDELIYESELRLAPGQRRTVTVPARGIGWGWWVAGGAVVAAAGATTAYFATRPSDGGSVGTAGTLNPNRVEVSGR